MTYLWPFFLLLGRAAVFWVGAAVLLGLSILLLGIGQPDEITSPYVNVVFLSAFGFPAAAGWLAGAIIQEFQSCSFAWSLPNVTKRTAAGFLGTGLMISLVVAGLASQSPANSLGFTILLTLGLAGYCLGGNFFAPIPSWTGTLNLVVVIVLVARSRYLAGLATSHPLPTITISLGFAVFGLVRLFSRSSLRNRPFRATPPFPGSYSLERSQRYERQKLSREGPKRIGWRAGYLGTDIWSWARAANHEVYGPLGWKTVLRIIGRLWVVGLLMVIYAWTDQGDLTFAESLGKTIYHALFNSPHVPAFGDRGGPTPLLILVISAAGAALALHSPAGLQTSLSYPLSRQRLARVTHRADLVETATFFIGMLLTLTTAGHLAGWFVGYETRFDFVPFFLRPLTATVILMPLAYWGRLHLRIATQRKTENTLIAIIFGVVGFVVVVWIWTAISPWLFPGPLIELTFSALLFFLSHEIYRRMLRRYFSTADLL